MDSRRYYRRGSARATMKCTFVLPEVPFSLSGFIKDVLFIINAWLFYSRHKDQGAPIRVWEADDPEDPDKKFLTIGMAYQSGNYFCYSSKEELLK